MSSFVTLGLLAGLILFVVWVRFLPIRKEILITGQFIRKSEDCDFYDRKYWVFTFRAYCVQCYLANKEPLYFDCTQGIPNWRKKSQPQF